MINFNGLPTTKPTNLPEPGKYFATITSAEMKQGHDVNKPPYLNLCLTLKNKDGRICGKVYDIISESDKDLVRFKTARFIIALGLTELGEFELRDLVRIVKDKELIVDIRQDEAKNGYPAKAVVDAFSGDIYYPIEEATTLFGIEAPTHKIHASDAADVHTVDDDEF